MSQNCNFINCFLYRWVVKIQNRNQQNRKYLYKYKMISWIENICKYGPRHLPLPGLLDKGSGVHKCSGGWLQLWGDCFQVSGAFLGVGGLQAMPLGARVYGVRPASWKSRYSPF